MMVGTESLRRIIDQISRDKGIERALLVDAIEEAVRQAVKKRYGGQRDIEVQYNEELGEVEVFQYRTVVETVVNEAREISLEEARLRDPEAGLDDDIGEKLTNIAELGRIAAQSAKQVIIHRMREAERSVIYDMYRDREGTVVHGIVQRFDRGDMIVNLGRTDALLPKEGQIPKRSYKQGDRIRAYLQQVRRVNREGEPPPTGREARSRFRDAQLILSRTCNEFLAKLFEMEVPEIQEGIVKIMAVSRDPGYRAKIAVSSLESDVDPVGACVGLKGARVQNVVQELQGERIDIVIWSPDPVKYVCNALAPAVVNTVEVDEEGKTLLVVVPDDQLSLAIGRQGQNVRLASRLLGNAWRIDVKDQRRYDNLQRASYRSLLMIDGVDEVMADGFVDAGITSAAVLAETGPEHLAELLGAGEDEIRDMRESARRAASAMAEELAAEARADEEARLAASRAAEAAAAEAENAAGDDDEDDAGETRARVVRPAPEMSGEAESAAAGGASEAPDAAANEAADGGAEETPSGD